MAMNCPRCSMRGIHTTDGLTSCLYCGEVIRDEPTLAQRMISNATPEIDPTRNHHWGARLAPIEAPPEVTARVLAAIRREAGCGG